MAVAVFPPCCLTWGQVMVDVMRIMVTFFKRSHAHRALTNAPNLAAGHHPPMPPLNTPGRSRTSLDQSLLESLLPSPGSLCVQDFVFALQLSVSPVLCKFWWLYGGVNVDLFEEGLCHTYVCCTQSPWPCSSPLLTVTSTGDTQTQFWPSLCGVFGSLLLRLLLCPWMWDIFFWWDPTFFCQWLFSSVL